MFCAKVGGGVCLQCLAMSPQVREIRRPGKGQDGSRRAAGVRDRERGREGEEERERKRENFLERREERLTG